MSAAAASAPAHRHTGGPGSGTDAIPSLGLGAIERSIGLREEVLGGVDSQAGEGRDADARRQPQPRPSRAGRVTEDEGLRLDALADTLGERRGPRTGGLRQDDDELFAP